MRKPTSSTANRPAPRKSPRLVWAITFGEAALLGGAAFVLFKYWLMVPSPWRLGGAGVLGVLALLCAYRVVRFYRRAGLARENAPSQAEPEPVPAMETRTTLPPPRERKTHNPSMLASSEPSTTL